MKVDLWVEVTEENIERLTALYLRVYPGADLRFAFSEVKIGRYINFDANYQTLERQLESSTSTQFMHEFSRMVDVDEFMSAVFEHSLNQ